MNDLNERYAPTTGDRGVQEPPLHYLSRYYRLLPNGNFMLKDAITGEWRELK